MEYRVPDKDYDQPPTPAASPSSPSSPSAEPPASQKSEKNPSSKRDLTRLLFWLGIILLLAACIGGAVYYMNRYHQSQQQVKKLTAASQKPTAEQQNQQLIAQIGKITQLPQGETPTVATVTDITKLKDQVFFANAQNGDKVLIYTQAKEAYLYRPSTNKIINIAPVNLGTSSSGSGSTTPSSNSSSNKTP